MSQAKNTAHRPSQSDQEYVINSRGMKVRNTAYIPKPKNNTAQGADPIELPDSSAGFDIMDMHYAAGWYEGDMGDYVDYHVSNLEVLSQQLQKDMPADPEMLRDVKAFMDSFSYLETGKYMTGKVDDNSKAFVEELKNNGLNVSYEAKNSTKNHDLDNPSLGVNKVNITSDDPDMPTTIELQEGNNSGTNLKLDFGNKTGAGVVSVEQNYKWTNLPGSEGWHKPGNPRYGELSGTTIVTRNQQGELMEEKFENGEFISSRNL